MANAGVRSTPFGMLRCGASSLHQNLTLVTSPVGASHTCGPNIRKTASLAGACLQNFLKPAVPWNWALEHSLPHQFVLMLSERLPESKPMELGYRNSAYRTFSKVSPEDASALLERKSTALLGSAPSKWRCKELQQGLFLSGDQPSQEKTNS